MKSYEFSMERVLKWREDIEKSNMEDLAVIQNELKEQQFVLDNLITEQQNAKRNGRRYNDINQFKYQHLYVQKIGEKIERQDELIYKTNARLEDARLELIEAQKDRKIMEKLKEKDMNNYSNNIKMAEQRELDEIAVLKYKNQNLI